MTSRDVLDAHRAAGRRFEAAGVGSFVREHGEGITPVVCLHGVPASSFLYRKVLAELVAHGLRGVAFDLPGLGLADRPARFDYTWTGLGRFSAAAVDALGLERFHLVVPDIGGPVGFELAAAMPGRIASLTVLDTLVEVDTFTRPWSMEPFARQGIGELYLCVLTKPAFRMLMRLQGVGDMASVPRAGDRRLRRPSAPARRRARVPEDHARLRAYAREARPVHARAPRRPLPGADRLGRRRPGAQARRRG